jgi:hypothetical protein
VGDGSDQVALDLALGGDGDVITVGWFEGSVDFDSGPGETILTSQGLQDVFVQKTDATGALHWARRVGGSLGDVGDSVAIDADDNIYLTGSFRGTADFDPGPDLLEQTSQGDGDSFILKLDADGNLLWARTMGAEDSHGIAVDANRNVYTTGFFTHTTDFDPGEGEVLRTVDERTDAFVLKLDANGDFVWVVTVGDSGFDEGNGIAVDAGGYVSVTGIGDGDFDPGPGEAIPRRGGIFVWKLTNDGALAWVRVFDTQTPGEQNGFDVAVDGVGNVYSAGFFRGKLIFDFQNNLHADSFGYWDAYVLKLSAAGDLLWAWGLGGGHAQARGLALDPAGGVYITGHFTGRADLHRPVEGGRPRQTIEGETNLESDGFDDIFVMKLSTDGDLLWTEGVSGTGANQGRAIVTDGNCRAYIAGSIEGTAAFDLGGATAEITSAGNRDAFLATLTPTFDVDSDCDTDIIDLQHIINAILEEGPAEGLNTDVNGDGVTNVIDLTALVQDLLSD